MAWIAIIAIIIVVVLFIAVILTAVIVNYTVENNTTPSTPPTPPTQLCTDVDPQTLPDISYLPCCDFTARKYVNNLNEVDYDFVSGPGQINWFIVCRGFCTQGWDFNSQNCFNLAGQSEFERCQNQIKPTTCVGTAAPVFSSQNKLYFAQSATDSLCPVQKECTF